MFAAPLAVLALVAVATAHPHAVPPASLVQDLATAPLGDGPIITGNGSFRYQYDPTKVRSEASLASPLRTPCPFLSMAATHPSLPSSFCRA